jgi:D-methionine transport system substrate-binding protein
VAGLLAALFLAGCKGQGGPVLKVGVTRGPQAKIVANIKERAGREGFFFEIVEYGTFEFAANYIKINTDLKEGKIDLNCFQNQLWLEDVNKKLPADFVAVGQCYINPMGIYSVRHADLSGLPAGAAVFVPDSFAGMARALLLLERAGLVTLKPAAGHAPALDSVQDNPLRLKITPIDASLLNEGLLAGDLALISSGYAAAAGLALKDALLLEDESSPFVQIIVTGAKNARNPGVIKFVEYYQSQATRRFIEEEYKGRLVPARARPASHVIYS